MFHTKDVNEYIQGMSGLNLNRYSTPQYPKHKHALADFRGKTSNMQQLALV